MTAFTKHTIKTRTKHTRQDMRPKTVFVVSTSCDVCVDLSSVCSSGCCMVAPPAASNQPLQQEDKLIPGHWEAGPRLSKVWCQHQTGAGHHSQHRRGRGESGVVRSVWSVLSVPTAWCGVRCKGPSSPALQYSASLMLCRVGLQETAADRV